MPTVYGVVDTHSDGTFKGEHVATIVFQNDGRWHIHLRDDLGSATAKYKEPTFRWFLPQYGYKSFKAADHIAKAVVQELYAMGEW